MSIGSLIRKVLGPRVFQHVGRAYRRIFVDVRKTAQVLAEIIPPGAHVVDIGGGDGEPLNCLLRLRDDITVTMIDISPVVGWMIEESLLGRVERLAGTSIRQYLQLGPRAIQAAVVSDVLHHVPPGQREAFLGDLRDLLAQGGCSLLAVKEFAPHGLRGRLGYLADRYVSGDANVRLIPPAELADLLRAALPGAHIEDTRLSRIDSPNYALRVSLATPGR
ncbi:MAG TPA: class I SAM-dependent methyltransferase [Phycisphaerae bacterium]|nr:class I SAM-dependent methyltransferase [Phycisphaerae bacterium]HQL75830.1 class I SAM-dependent methyltransferase [Phycisphaerae bacterium]